MTRLRREALRRDREQAEIHLSRGYTVDSEGRKCLPYLDEGQIAWFRMIAGASARQLGNDDLAIKAKERDETFAKHILNQMSDDDDASIVAARKQLDDLEKVLRRYLGREIAPDLPALYRPPIPAATVNDEIKKVRNLAHRLKCALRSAEPSFRQRYGEDLWQPYDPDGTEARYRHFASYVEKYVEWAATFDDLPAPKGPLPKTHRTIAVARAAAYFERWTGAPPTRSGVFPAFLADMTQHVGLGVENLRDQIANVLRAYERGEDLEHWNGVAAKSENSSD
ncbi:hypothetical protein [Bauldia litoralis]|uniref:hypothetical protein n=1 Tax=Bauldia litoralis TaxID=665467 RepID=UPI0032650BA2